MAENTQSPVTIDSAQSLINLANNTQPIQQPYQYGNLGLTTSDYSLWGSKGNPYMTGGPGYNPGTRWGTPLTPQPIAPTPPNGGDSDYTPPPVTGGGSDNFWGEDSQGWGDLTYGDKAALGLFAPGLSTLGSLAYGRFDSPDGDYARLPWYEGSAGGGYGYTEEGYDQYAPGDTDRGIYDASTGERAWGDEFDDYNTGDLWAETSWFDGIGNVLGGRTWDGLEQPATFGDPKSALAQEATQLQLAEKAEKAANRQAIVDAEQAELDAEQAQWDAQYAQINDLNTQQVGLMNDIKSDMQNQYGTFQDEILSQVAAENASMFDSFADYKVWMGEAFTTQQSGLDEALAVAAAKTEGLNSTQIDLMNTIAEDMQTQYGEFSGGVGGQLEQMAAENASMFDSIEEYQAWMQDSTAEQQAWLTNEFKDQAAAQNNLNTTQSDLMNQIALDMQSQYGDFSGQTGEQLAQMAAENASLFDSFEEYKNWMSEEFTTLGSGLNEELAIQASISEGLNANQVDLMNQIAQDMTSQYGDFTGSVGGQLEQMAAENASLFDSFEEYKNWMSDNNNTDFLDMANPQPGVYTLNPVTGQYVGQSSVSFNNPYADSDLSSLGEQLGTGPGTSFTPSDSGGTVTVSTDTGSTSYDTTDLGGGQHSVDVSSDGEGPDSDVGWEDPNGGSSGSSDSNDGKVICTAMNEDYGFGAYRNAIWLKYAAINYADKPEMEAGYHALCLPMLRIRKKWYGKPTYAWLKHVAKHRTADLKAEMYGKKRDRIGQAWRFILEPLCYYVGKRLNNGDK